MASQKTKKRIRSVATKTPRAPVSSISRKKRKVAASRAGLSSRSRKETRTAMGLSKVVRSSSHRLMPSTPTW
jgi:hypothetical protein